MRNIEFITHTGTSRPVPIGTYVIYRTVSECNKAGVASISNIIHQPMLAENIDWTDKPVLGRIYEYAAVDEPKGLRRWVISKSKASRLKSRGRTINDGSKNRKQYA